MGNFSMRLNEHRKELIEEAKEKTKLEAESKAVTRALELFLKYRSYFEEKYEEFEELRGEYPLK